MREIMKEKRLFVVTGPSGAGLKELAGRLFETRGDVAAVLPVTARKMKPGERDGVGFRFFDLEGWEALRQSGDLIEQTELAGNDYGTSRALVAEILRAGRNVLLNVEPERAAQIKKNMPEAVCLYVEPSDPEILLERWRQTARSEIELKVRMREAERLRALSGFCDEHIDSSNLQAAERELTRLLDETK